MVNGRQGRIKKAKKKITELINKGVQFNPSTVSGYTLTAAGASGSRNPFMKSQSKLEREYRIEKVGTSEKPLSKKLRKKKSDWRG